jgi:hypothetical protein
VIENGEGVLDKEATSHDDLFDSFRVIAAVLALKPALSPVVRIS